MIKTLARSYRDYRDRKLVSAHLARMNDHELCDIGVARQDIDLVLRGGRLHP